MRESLGIFPISRVANIHLSESALLQAAVIPAHLCGNVFRPTEYNKTLRHNGWYPTAFDSVRGIFSALSSRSVAKKAIACESSGFGMSFLCSKKVEIMHRGLAVLSD